MRNWSKKIISGILAATMLTSTIPAFSASAEENISSEQQTEQTQSQQSSDEETQQPSDEETQNPSADQTESTEQDSSNDTSLLTDETDSVEIEPLAEVVSGKIDSGRIKIVEVSSEANGKYNSAEGYDGNKEYAIDGNSNTIWHSAWNSTNDGKFISFELDRVTNLTEIKYTRRAFGNENGVFMGCNIYTKINEDDQWTLSMESTGWIWDSSTTGRTKTLEFDEPVKAKYIKIVGITNNVFASAAEIELYENVAGQPTITTQPVGGYFDTAHQLSVEAEVSDGTATLSYQWYENAENSYFNATEIQGATDKTYNVNLQDGTKKYFFVKVTNDQSQSSVVSNVVMVGRGAYGAIVNDVGYENLYEAVQAATAGSTIYLMENDTIDSQIVINKNLTIAAPAGQTITLTRGSVLASKTVFEITSGAQFNIADGSGGKVIIDGGAVYNENGDFKSGIDASNYLIKITNGRLYINSNAVIQNNYSSNNAISGTIYTNAGGSSQIHIYGTVKDNHMAGNGGAIYSSGYITVYASAVISGNKAGGDGGAIYNYSGGVVTINGGLFENNSAGNDGGAIWTDGKCTFNDGTIRNNTAGSNGGGVYVFAGATNRNGEFYGASITGNDAAKNGNDVYMCNDRSYFKGGVTVGEVYVPENCTLWVNGTLSGSIGVIYGGDVGASGRKIAGGSGYTIKASDAEKIFSSEDKIVFKYENSSIMGYYAPVKINTQPVSIEKVNLNGTATLTVDAESLAGTELSYQWYKCDDTAGNNPVALNGANESSYTTDTSAEGTYYYYCEISADKAQNSKTDIVSVRVVDNSQAEIPMIVTQPQSGTYDIRQQATLTVEAKVTDNGTLSYQWYKAAEAQSAGEAVTGETGTSLTIGNEVSGTYYYYCVVTNQKTGIAETRSAESERAEITVTEAAAAFNDVKYSNFSEAFEALKAANYSGTLELYKDAVLSETIPLTSGTELTIKADVNADGTVPKITLDSAFKNEAFNLSGGTLTIENVAIDGGAVWVNDGSFSETYLKRGAGNRGRSANKPLIMFNGGTVTLKGSASLQNNIANGSNGGAVTMSSGTLNINDSSKITGHYVSGHGGAIYASSSDSVININGGVISSNQGRTSTGGICADTGTIININGGIIENNFSTGRGGGLFVNGTLTMTGGEIRSNYSGYNGGGIVLVGGTQNISGGRIHSNTAATYGGGICQILGTLTFTGTASVDGNYASNNGGGIASIGGPLTISGGSIINNNAAGNGGGLFKNTEQNVAALSITGGLFENNFAAVSGDSKIKNDAYVTRYVNLGTFSIPKQTDDVYYFEHTFVLTLNENYEYGSETHNSVRFLSKYELPTPERNGYRFLGWFTQPDGGEQKETGYYFVEKTGVTLYAHWEMTATNTITITQQPVGGIFYVEDNSKINTSAVIASDNEESAQADAQLKYQWYSCSDLNGSNGQPIENANTAEMALPNTEEQTGTYYYYCVVSGDNAADARTDVVRVDMLSRNIATVPVFNTQPGNVDCFVGDDAVFSANASTIDLGTVTYQWYESDDNTANPDADRAIASATEAEFCLNTSAAGTKYYYVVATNTITKPDGQQTTATAISNVARLDCHNKIGVSYVNSNDEIMTPAYWDKYGVSYSESKDGYISNVASCYGSYGNNTVNKLYDRNWGTFWETNMGGVKNYLEFTFEGSAKVDRILYATRQDGLKGRGYPTTLTIYAADDSEHYREVGVAKSSEYTGYLIFTLPETVELKGKMRFEFTVSTYNNWASAAELILLRAEDTVIEGSVNVTGTAVPGSQLTANVSVTNASSDNIAYQWQHSSDNSVFTDIDGATGKTYTIDNIYKNEYIRVVARDGSKEYSGTLVSPSYRGLFVSKLEGDAAVGATLTAKTEYTLGTESFSYVWQRGSSASDFTEISFAQGATYNVSALDINSYIRVGIRCNDYSSSFSEYVYSEPIFIDVTATMTGAPQVGSTLSGSLSGYDREVSYQWQISDTETGEFTNIPDATEKEYTIPEEYLNKYIRVAITVKESSRQLVSEAWQIAQAGTYPELTGDYIYLSDFPSSDILESWVGFGNLMYDKNTSGGTISLKVGGERTYFMKGFGMHADSGLVFDVSDYVKYYHYDRFQGYIGLDFAQGSNGDGVLFDVSVAETYEGSSTKWTRVVTTQALKGNSEAVYVDLDLTNVNYIRVHAGYNGSAASDHAVLADAKLVSKNYKPADSGSIIQRVDQYDAEIKAYEQAHSGMSYTELLNDREYEILVLRRTFVNDATYSLLKAFLYNDDNIRTMTWFMNDLEALRMYIGGGRPDGSYGRSMEVLRDLYIKHGDDMSDPAHGSLYKKMIITLSLTHSTDVYFWQDTSQKSDPVKRYEIYKKLYDNGLLINNVFENLEVEEMRWVMNNIISDDQIEWVNYYVRYHTNIGNKDINKNNYTPGPYYFIRYTMGFNYNQPQFYAADMQETWEKKWKLDSQYIYDDIKDTNVQNPDKIGVYDIDVEYGKVKLWIVFEAGAVCGGISKTGSNLNTAFGIPSVVIGQPGHAAYLQFSTTADDTTGKWDIYNDISGWTGSEKGERMLNSWGSYNWDSGYQVSYVLLAQAALNDPDNYYKSQKLVKIADMYKDDAQKRIELYREALNVQNINLDAWLGLIDAYKQAGKSEQEFAELANEISQALTYYPLPMWDVLERLIKPNVSSDKYLGDVSTSQTMALVKAKNATASQTLQNSACRTMANHLLGNSNFEMATFSFDGDKAGTIVLNEMYSGGNEVLICLNGHPEDSSSANWISLGLVTEFKLTDEQLNMITAENDIHVRLQGTTSYYTIDITAGSLPGGLYLNDNENKIIGDISNLQYLTESGEWKDLTSEVTFPGDVTVKIRKKAAGTTLQSGTQDYTFTFDKDTDNRKYITLDKVQYVGCSSEQVDKNGSALHALDGNINTVWHTWWAGGDNERYIIVKLAEPVYLTAFDYTPVQSGNGNGRFQSCEIYTSMTGEDNSWTLSGSASGWGNNSNKKSLELYNPVYTQYIKVRAAQGVNNFGSAAMFEFFEDTTVENKEIESIEVQTMPSKIEYVVGDELDITGLEVKAHFTDGTDGVINNSMLKFDPTIFESTGEKTITVTSAQNTAVTTSFNITVSENNKTVSDIFVSQMPEKTRYFVGDTVDAKGLVVKANYTDGSQGYIFDSQYTVFPETLSESGLEIPVTIAYTADPSKTTTYNVEVTKTVKEIIVTHNPEKTNYYLGDAIDTTGIEVSVKYVDDTVDVLESYDYLVNSTGFSNTSGTKQIAVSYQRLESVKPAEFSVLVYPYITSGNLRYESVDNTDTCFVSGVNGSLPSDGKVIIPSTVSVGDLEFTVIAVGKDSANATGAFTGQTGISSVVFPGTVNTITADAFSGCTGIRELYFTEHDSFESLEVQAGAFANDESSIGIIYVQSQELADSLNNAINSNEKLAGLKYFRAQPITNNIENIKLVPPTKLTYNIGESLDLTGFSVVGITNDNKEVALSENLYTISGFNSEVAGNQDIKVVLNNTDLSKTFTVQVVPATPVITTQPVGAVYGAAEEKAPLTVEASISDKGNISYQWYSSATESTEGGTKLDGAVESSYVPVNSQKTYYYVVISNKDKNNTENTASSITSNIVCVDVGDYSARIEGVGYNDLQTAVNDAQDGDRIEILKNIDLTSAVYVNNKNDMTITISGMQIKRTTSTRAVPLITVDSGNIVFENITIDGGAIWDKNYSEVLGRNTNNAGVSAQETIVLVSGGSLTLGEGAILQNNCNDKYESFGGALRMTGNSTKLIIDGGSIINNYETRFGGAIYMNNSSSLTFNKGTISGNQSKDVGGVICVDNSSTFVMNGGNINNNFGQSNGGVIWLSDGSASFNGGVISYNNTSGNGTVFMNGSGTVNLGNVSMSGNKSNGGTAVHNGNGTLRITGKPSLSDNTVYLGNGKTITVQANLQGADKIKIVGDSNLTSGRTIASVLNADYAKAAAETLVVDGLRTYAEGQNIKLGANVNISIDKDLPAEMTIFAGTQLELEITAIGSDDLVYTWYRCDDAQGSNPQKLENSSSEKNKYVSGDCSIGVCYFYCEVSVDDSSVTPVKSNIVKVNVIKFVPCSQAIEKFKNL